MSLFGSLQVASNTLQAMQVGLQVVGNNIANANTEGFIREKVNYAPAPVQEKGNLIIGLGVQVDSITQVLDEYLGEQLRGANQDKIGAEIQNQAYKDLERLLGELSSNDLSTSLTGFFGSIEDTLNATSGDALSVRNLVVLEGEKLSGEIQRIDERASQIQSTYDDQIRAAGDQINQLAAQIQDLNIRITQVEGGGNSGSDAGALRTERRLLTDQLTELVGAQVEEQPGGGLSITVGGEFLVFEGQRREVYIQESDDPNAASATIRFSDTNKELDLGGGRIYGLSSARDEIVGTFREDLDSLAKNLIFEFNKVFSSGQGLSGFQDLTSAESVSNADVPLDQAGLAFTPQNGEFNITVVNKNTGDEETTRINIRLLGGADDTTLNDLRSQIDDVNGISATIDSQGRLRIQSDASDTEFFFSGDTNAQGDSSHVLAALGLNTFFTGSGAGSISVNSELDGIENASKFASSNLGLGAGTDNATRLAALISEPLDALEGASLLGQYEQLVNELAQNSTVAGSVLEGLSIFADTLDAEFQAMSGVNIDEEAIEMISLQRIYQATGRYISVIQEMLDTLISI